MGMPLVSKFLLLFGGRSKERIGGNSLLRHPLFASSPRQPRWRNFEHKSSKIALKIAFPRKLLLNVQPGAARIAPSSIEKSLY